MSDAIRPVTPSRPVRKKTRLLRRSAVTPSVNGLDTESTKGLSCEQVDIRQPPAHRHAYTMPGLPDQILCRCFVPARQTPECPCRLRVGLDKSAAHLGTNLESLRTNGGTQIGKQARTGQAHGRHGSLQDAGLQAAPAGVRGCDDAAGAVTEQHRQAVCRHHPADDTSLVRKCSVGGRNLRRGCRNGSVNDRCAVHLVEPERRRRQPTGQPPSILAATASGSSPT